MKNNGPTRLDGGRFKLTGDTSNKDLLPGETRHDARSRLLDAYATTFVPRMKVPPVTAWDRDRWILRADKVEGGLKAYAAEQMIAESDLPAVSYVMPRVGHAGDAIANVAKVYGKKCYFFSPAAKLPSVQQAHLYAYDHVELRYYRTPAMPLINIYAKKWSEQNDVMYIKFGMQGLPVVTAGLVRMFRKVSKNIGGDPTCVFMAVSTGTMMRACQIAWPKAEMWGVAVSRNTKPGELGEAHMMSAREAFHRPVGHVDRTPFPSTACYDMKAWTLFETLGIPGSLFLNVGSDESLSANPIDLNAVDSDIPWGDKRAFEPLPGYDSDIHI